MQRTFSTSRQTTVTPPFIESTALRTVRLVFRLLSALGGAGVGLLIAMELGISPPPGYLYIVVVAICALGCGVGYLLGNAWLSGVLEDLYQMDIHPNRFIAAARAGSSRGAWLGAIATGLVLLALACLDPISIAIAAIVLLPAGAVVGAAVGLLGSIVLFTFCNSEIPSADDDTKTRLVLERTDNRPTLTTPATFAGRVSLCIVGGATGMLVGVMEHGRTSGAAGYSIEATYMLTVSLAGLMGIVWAITWQVLMSTRTLWPWKPPDVFCGAMVGAVVGYNVTLVFRLVLKALFGGRGFVLILLDALLSGATSGIALGFIVALYFTCWHAHQSTDPGEDT